MHDDELTRARRALHGVDPEIDLARVYAESRARARGPATGDAQDGWAEAEGVEILLHEAGSEARPVPSASRRRPALAWGLAAAAAGVLAVSLAGPPVLRALPGSEPSTSTSPSAASPSPTLGLTPSDVVARAAQAIAGETCSVETRSTLGDQSALRFDHEPSAVDVPKTTLDQKPLSVLQAAAVGAVSDLSTLNGTDRQLDEDLGIEELDGNTVARIRITPADAVVVGGDVTRIDLLVDLTTWLPLAEEMWAESDQGEQYLLRSELRWKACGEPTAAPSAGGIDGPSPTPSVNTDQ
ncbi:hypothetical protein C8K30_106385 [Promicromonospora sp. AC04]|uniref:hypothetical protein n=1 Tax=Promicromonospora sp. AC04 TaxID=2135723 RepID=UPI000D34CA89|nr:hypothetical protein [Promicromonospora sp. AC04]PUB26296.1 hypothetical protein C8K30_106385 [Promicromonospora sp. AC04]